MAAENCLGGRLQIRSRLKEKTLFKKYVKTNFIIVTIGLLFFAALFLLYVTSCWKQEKKEALTRDAEKISKVFLESSDAQKEGFAAFIKERGIECFFEILFGNTGQGYDRFIVNNNGDLLFSSVKDKSLPQDFKPVPEKILKTALEGKYVGSNSFRGIYDVPYFAVGIPVFVDDEKIGALFMTDSQKYMFKFYEDIVKILAIIVFLALIISALSAVLISMRTMKPLKNMLVATKEFSKGNFEKRIEISKIKEIGRLSLSFNEMADSLWTLEKSRKDFIANISHELRTPMTVILGFVEGILDKTISVKDQERYLKIIKSEIKRLSRLVYNLLKLSRIDGVGIKQIKKNVNVSRVLSNVISSFEKQIFEKNIKLEDLSDEKNVIICSDEDALYQVFYNLVENSVKFVEKYGTICFKISKNNNEMKFFIKNTGKDIPEAEIKNVFDKFYKVNQKENQGANSAGLGLYIVKSIVKSLNGNIACESKNKITKFSFSIIV